MPQPVVAELPQEPFYHTEFSLVPVENEYDPFRPNDYEGFLEGALEPYAWQGGGTSADSPCVQSERIAGGRRRTRKRRGGGESGTEAGVCRAHGTALPPVWLFNPRSRPACRYRK